MITPGSSAIRVDQVLTRSTDDWPANLPPLVSSEPLAGGKIGRTELGRLADGTVVVVKRCPYPAEQEAEGLRALADAGVPVPRVLGLCADTLILEFLAGPPDFAELGRAIARLHRNTGPRFGWHQDNFHGRFTQDNRWCDDWPTFYADRRVLGHLVRTDVAADRIEKACAGPLPALLRQDPRPSLTHGDLWVGNMVSGRWLVDPAVCYADRELDLAYLRLSETVPPELFQAYQAEFPIDPGFAERLPALQLHKRVLNVRHFGAAQLPKLLAVLDHYGW